MSGCSIAPTLPERVSSESMTSWDPLRYTGGAWSLRGVSLPRGSTLALQRGHVEWEWSHTSMHPTWNRCLHAGSCRTASPSCTMLRHTAHCAHRRRRRRRAAAAAVAAATSAAAGAGAGASAHSSLQYTNDGSVATAEALSRRRCRRRRRGRTAWPPRRRRCRRRGGGGGSRGTRRARSWGWRRRWRRSRCRGGRACRACCTRPGPSSTAASWSSTTATWPASSIDQS